MVDPVFTLYTILLLVSGVGLVIMGATLPGQGTGTRALNILVGLAFLGYGIRRRSRVDPWSTRIWDARGCR